MTEAQIRANLEYYGLEGEALESCLQAYQERQADGDAPDLGEFAEAWSQL